jgi:WD40 repeat protein
MTISNPYVGPRAFKTGEKIYGRDAELRDLLDLLIAERIVLLYSPSGAGKTSLIQAGLIPSLEEENFRLLPTARVNLQPPTTFPKDSLPNRYVLSFLLSLEEALPEEKKQPLQELAGLTVDEYLKEFPRGADDPDTAVLIFDQFEEILSLSPTDQDAKTEFFSQIGSALRNRKRWALFSMREDYVAALDPYLRFVPTRLRNTFRLDRLEVRSARQAIQQPAREAGVDFQDKAANLLADDLRRVRVQRPDGTVEDQLGQYVEPVQLQVVCYRLWENRDSAGSQIQESDVRAIGTVDTALADYYADQVTAVSRATQASQRLIREWFDRQLITEQGIRSQVLMESEKSSGLDNQAIRLLEDAHLVRAEKRGGATWFELAHDRLIEPVRRDNATWLLKHLSLLQRSADLWQRNERPDRLLLRDKDLEKAENWAAGHDAELLPVEREFLEASQEICAREERERTLAQQAIELEAEKKRAELQARLTRIISAVGALAVVLAIIAGFLAVQSNQFAHMESTQRALADANRQTAQANERTAQAASTDAFNQKETAVVAQAIEASAKGTAVAGRATAQAASTQAEFQRATAEANAAVAASRELSSLALNYLGQQSDLALLLSVAAYQTSDTLQAKSALLTGLERALSRSVVPFGPFLPPRQNSDVYAVAFSPDGQRLAWSTQDGLIYLWDVPGQKIIETLENPSTTFIYSIAFSPDGNTLATAGADNYVVLWDVTPGQPARITQPRLFAKNIVHSISYNRDGSQLALASGSQIQIWDTALRRHIITLKGHNDTVNSVSWSPDGSRLASGGDDSRVWIWDANEMMRLYQQAGGGDNNQEVELEPNSGAGTVLPRQTSPIWSVSWSLNNRLLASGAGNGTITIWNAATLQPQGEPLKGHSRAVRSLAFDRDGTTLASAGDDATILFWDLNTRTQLPPITDNTLRVNSLAFSLKGKSLLASGSFDNTVGIYEVITQLPLGQNRGINLADVKALLSGADGDVLLAGSQSGSTLVAGFSPNTGNENDLPVATQNEPTSVALSPNQSWLALGYADGSLEIRSASTGESVQPPVQTGKGPISSLAFSPDSQTLASGLCGQVSQEGNNTFCSQNNIDLWDAATGDLLKEISTEHTDSILSLAFSPDGSSLASGSKDKTIILSDLSSGQQIERFPSRHSDSVISLAFSPQNGQMLASGSLDQTLILWDATTFQPIGQALLGANGGVTSLSFAPDSKTLVSGSDTGSITLWDVDIQSWEQRACKLAGRDLNPDEWRQFFPGRAQHDICQISPSETPSPSPTPAP